MANVKRQNKGVLVLVLYYPAAPSPCSLLFLLTSLKETSISLAFLSNSTSSTCTTTTLIYASTTAWSPAVQAARHWHVKGNAKEKTKAKSPQTTPYLTFSRKLPIFSRPHWAAHSAQRLRPSHPAVGALLSVFIDFFATFVMQKPGRHLLWYNGCFVQRQQRALICTFELL